MTDVSELGRFWLPCDPEDFVEGTLIVDENGVTLVTQDQLLVSGLSNREPITIQVYLQPITSSWWTLWSLKVALLLVVFSLKGTKKLGTVLLRSEEANTPAIARTTSHLWSFRSNR